MFPHMSVEMDQGARHVASGQADITVGTVQSLRQRLAKYDPSAFKCVIVDEAHHSTSPSYQAILSHFHCDLSPEPVTQVRTPIIGFSATFTRHDGVALGRIYEEIVYHKDFLDLMSEKWLCPIRFTLIRAGFDLSRVSSASGDYVPSSLARVVNQAPMNEVVVRSWIDLAWQKRRMTMLFITHDLVEAITLSDQVVVMTKRPGRVKERYRIPLARPRNVFEIYLEPGFDDAYGALWQHFKAEMSADQS